MLNAGPEVMHDILQGIFVNEVWLIFGYLTAKGVLTIDQVNVKIASFQYNVRC